MAMIWQPDFCPSGKCEYEVSQDWTTCISVRKCCPHHQALRDTGVSDQTLFESVVQSSRVKEAARSAAKEVMYGSPKAGPEIPFTVAADGTIEIVVNGVTVAVKNEVITAVDLAKKLVPKNEHAADARVK